MKFILCIIVTFTAVMTLLVNAALAADPVSASAESVALNAFSQK